MRLGTALSIVVVSAGTAAAAPHRVAVIPSVEVNVDAQRAEALTGTLADALREKLEIDAIGGADVIRRLPEGGLPDDCVAQPACIQQQGARLEADQLLFLVIVQVGHTIQLDPTWADVATGKTIARPRIDLADDARATTVFEDSAQALLPDTPLRPHDKTIVIHQGGDTIAPHRMTPASWATGGVTGVALGGAIILGLSTRSAYARCNHPESACTDDDIAGVHRRALEADVTTGIAIAAGVATAVLYLRSGGETLQVTPTSGGAAVTFGGSF